MDMTPPPIANLTTKSENETIQHGASRLGLAQVSSSWFEHGITRLLAEEGSATEAIPRIIEVICATFEWSCGAYWTLDKKTHSLHCAGTWGSASPGIDQFLVATSALPPQTINEYGLVRRTCATGEPQWIDNISVVDSFQRAPYAKNAGLHSAFAFPIQIGMQIIGAMEFFALKPRAADPELLQSMLYIGAQVGQFFHRKQTELELWRFRAAIDMSGDEIYLTDFATMRFLDVNETACVATGFTRQELLEQRPQDVWHISTEEIRRIYSEVISSGADGIKSQSIGKSRNGQAPPVIESHRRALRTGDSWVIVTTARDITSHVRATQTARRLGEMFAALCGTNEAIMRAKSPESLFRQVCDAAVSGAKFLTAAVVIPDMATNDMSFVAVAGKGEKWLRQSHTSVDSRHPMGSGLLGTALNTRLPCVSNYFLTDKLTQPWHTDAAKVGIAAGAAVPFIQSSGTLGMLLFYSAEEGVFDDEVVSLMQRMAANVAFALDNFEHEEDRKRGRSRIEYLASHDTLTGLPNRAMFSEMLGIAIHSARRYKRMFAVMFIDLDRFKLINDSLGHQAGDLLLKEIAVRLKDCVRSSDVIARLGGDEFVLLAQELSELSQITTVARKILAATMKPVMLLGQECRITASIGISLFPTDADDEQALMKNADIAMYFAKDQGKNNFQFFSMGIHAQSLERLTLETSLRTAIERNELALHYQAKLDLMTGEITGVEALLRWTNPDFGNVLPAQFIPIAEETGLIVPIGKWVLRTACTQNMRWQDEGLPPMCIAVNLSPRQFNDRFLLRDLEEVLRETGMPAELLELEITEGMVIQEPEKATDLLMSIKEMGVRLAIDDFGTGYASLGQLRSYPVDTLKVDRSFIRELVNNGEDRAITEAIIAMGKTLSLKVVAEGVETQEQEDFLRANACDEMQGYYFSKPISADQFGELLRHHVAVKSPNKGS